VKTNIALIGFMGTGKTTIAKILCEKLGKKLVELDNLIEIKAKKTIPDIFQQDGEISFRELEMKVTKEVSTRDNQIISCGGGIVLNNKNIDRLKKGAVVICLMASPRVIQNRVDTDRITRPLLKKDDKALTIKEMLEFRQPLYENAADIIIDTSTLNTTTIAEIIIARLKEYEGYN
jgi:shikimate kinase